MAHSYDVAMFQAALEKKTHLLPKGTQSTTTRGQPKIKGAMDSEVTLVEASSTSGAQKESSKGGQKPWLICSLCLSLMEDAVPKSSESKV